MAERAESFSGNLKVVMVGSCRSKPSGKVEPPEARAEEYSAFSPGDRRGDCVSMSVGHMEIKDG